MSGSQKVLKVFGILELLIAIYYAYLGIAGGNAAAFVSAALYLVACYLLLAAAKDARKAGGAWLITLVDLILSIAEIGFAMSGGADGSAFAAGGVAVVLNLIAFIAANNVKKQGKNS